MENGKTNTYEWTVVTAWIFNFLTVLGPAETRYVAVEIEGVNLVLIAQVQQNHQTGVVSCNGPKIFERLKDRNRLLNWSYRWQ